jgi:hypothetical protein
MKPPILLLCALGVLLPAGPAGRAHEAAPARTLLVEVDGVPAAEQTRNGAFGFDDYDRVRLVSLVDNRAMVLATPAELTALRARGFAAKVVMESPDPLQLYRRALYGPTLKLDPVYHSYGQIVARANELMAAHPRLMTRFPIGESTQFHVPIYAYRLSDDARHAQDRPAVLFDGCHHADEVMGAEIVLALMEKFIAGYGIDPAVTHWLDTLEIYLVPVVNVDGHNIVTSSRDPRWRKNVRDVNGDGVTGVYPEGVDVNRGYSFNWAMGGSSDPAAPNYRGPHPFSEAENRAMRALADRRQFLLSISYHSQGEVVYYPWAWGQMAAPDDKVIRPIAAAVAAQIRTMDGAGTYAVSPGAPSSQSYPWFYGRRGDIDLIVETGKGAHLFPAGDVPGIIAENLKGAAALLNHAAGPGLSVRVTDAKSGRPLAADVWLPRIDNETIDRRRSDAAFGRAWRLLNPGEYDLVISRAGYETAVLPAVQVSAAGWTALEAKLVPRQNG